MMKTTSDIEEVDDVLPTTKVKIPVTGEYTKGPRWKRWRSKERVEVFDAGDKRSEIMWINLRKSVDGCSYRSVTLFEGSPVHLAFTATPYGHLQCRYTDHPETASYRVEWHEGREDNEKVLRELRWILDWLSGPGVKRSEFSNR